MEYSLDPTNCILSFICFSFFVCLVLFFLTSEGHKSMSYSILTVLIPGGTLWSQMKKYGIYFSWIVASGWMVLISTLELSWQRRCEEVMAIIMS